MATSKRLEQEASTMAEPSSPAGAAERLRWLQEDSMKPVGLDIVISGMSGRFPKSGSINELEHNFRHSIDMIQDEDETRYECGLFGLPPRAGRLNDVANFDYQFFGYPLKQANFLDVQVRLLYEVVYESLLDAGINPRQLRGCARTGVYVGIHYHNWELHITDKAEDQVTSIPYHCQASSRVANYFDLRGPNVNTDAACASSSIAFDAAVQAIDLGLIDRAIVAGTSVQLSPKDYLTFLRLGMLSPGGHSRFLDVKADGYVKAESVCAIVLERTGLAKRNYAQVMVSATTMDGYKEAGITFPSHEGQERLLRSAKRMAGVHTNFIEYIEAHGTGTPVGDPEELEAISNVYSPAKQSSSSGDDDGDETRLIGPLWTASCKSNMGHPEGPSGLCSIIKVLLMFENELIYKSLNFDEPNPRIESLMAGRIRIVQQNRKLNAKIVPVSCYGFGGCNVHTILRCQEPSLGSIEAQMEAHGRLHRLGHDKAPRLVAMFGRGHSQLDKFFDNLLNNDSIYTRNCLSDDFLQLLDVLNSGPIDRLMNYRGYLIVEGQGHANCKQISRSISQCQLEPISNDGDDDATTSHHQDSKQVQCNLIFAGLGCDWPRMAAGLTQYKPFWSTIERIASKQKATFTDICQLITTNTNKYTNMADKFAAIASYQLALVDMILGQARIGQVATMAGHSMGEISCACARGLINEHEALLVAQTIGKTLDDNLHLCGGKMIALMVDEADARKLIKQSQESQPQYKSVQVACINGPISVSVSGYHAEIDQFCEYLTSKSHWFKLVEDTVALHNQAIMGQDMKEKLCANINKALGGRQVSCWTQGNWVPTVSLPEIRDMTLAEYLAECMCRRVEFMAALESIIGPNSIMLEISPSSLFESQVKIMNSSSSQSSQVRYIKMMHHSTKIEQQVAILLKSLGDLYLAGATMDLCNFNGSQLDRNRKVRRQTPSVSSLMAALWNHDEALLVPRYPQHFSSSSSSHIIDFGADWEQQLYLCDHQIEGRALFPATGYVYLAWKYFSIIVGQFNDTHLADEQYLPVEFNQIQFHRAFIVTKQSRLVFLFDQGSGKFAFLDNDAIVCEGYIKSPQFKPGELMYESVRRRMEREDLDLSMTDEDIYRQFRVRGYDYGEHFRLIKSASLDGSKSIVKYNQRFISFADAIIQLVTWAGTRFAIKGLLTLPTSINYVRIEPQQLIDKLQYSGMAIEQRLASRDAKRELMDLLNDEPGAAEPVTQEPEVAKTDKPQEQASSSPGECLFEVFCDVKLNILVTNGMEFRGFGGTSAPYKPTDAKIMSYEFVKDSELPIDRLGEIEAKIELYSQNCNKIASDWLDKMSSNEKQSGILNGFHQLNQSVNNNIDREMVDFYLSRQLRCLATSAIMQSEQHQEQPSAECYDITKRNGDKVLLSILNQLEQRVTQLDEARKMLLKCKRLLSGDILQQVSCNNDRLLRPLVDMAVDNLFHKQKRMSLVEVNYGKNISFKRVEEFVSDYDKNYDLDYSLVHKADDAIEINELLARGSEACDVKLMQMDLIHEKKLKLSNELDMVIYRDQTCYLDANMAMMSNDNLIKDLQCYVDCVRQGGFVLVIMRNRVSLAESIVMSILETKLSESIQLDVNKMSKHDDNMRLVNGLYASRCNYVESYATGDSMKLRCVSKRSDSCGNVMMLFRKFERVMTEAELDTNNNTMVLRVSHENSKDLDGWIKRLKQNFCSSSSSGTGNTDDQSDFDWDSDDEYDYEKDDNKHNGKLDTEEPQASSSSSMGTKTVWLCAVATKQSDMNGLIGLMQSLKAELGSNHLRCYYDMHTFRGVDEPVELADITSCDRFKFALERDFFWNCVDAQGNFGAFRHFETDHYLNHESCKTDDQHLSYKPSKPTQAIAEPRYVGEYADLATKGDLSSFTWYKCPYEHLSEAQSNKLVAVSYSALNFRDVMLASGRLPIDALPVKVALVDCPLGLEYSGYEIGSGKRVMGMCIGRALATRVLGSDDFATQFEVPGWLSLREAATLPVVYTTAIMALVVRGKMRRGESVLIHAGSGGVGQAAIRLCAHHGLVIYTTVGTPEKRQFLLEEFGYCLEESRIFSSRNCNFEHQLMAATRGRGVDLILNSLSEDKLQASIRCLADGGRFLEIGKYDLAQNAKMELLLMDTNKSYHGIVLDKMHDTHDQSRGFERATKLMLDIFQDGLDNRYIQPIKHTVFRRNQIEEAFRFMAQGKHIGKVLVEMNSPEMFSAGWEPQMQVAPRIDVSPLKSYIVTGGLGGFGFELCKWLARRGVRKLLVTSRLGKLNGYQQAYIDIMREVNGCDIQIVTASMANTLERDGCHELLCLATQMSPIGKIGGIFHLAMVLRDNLLENMTTHDFELVCKPKLTTGIYLDELTSVSASTSSHLYNVDYFVCFSSAASGKGNAGQSNYAYANSALERICERRRLRGQHGLAIQWGAIGDVGFVYENMGGNDVIIAGTAVQRMPSCMDAFGKLIGSPFGVCSSIVTVESKTDNFAEGDLKASIFNILGVKDSLRIDEQAKLGDIGLDSLMAVEIRHHIEQEFDKTLSVQEIRSMKIADLQKFSDEAATKRSQSATTTNADKTTDEAKPELRQVVGYGQMEQQQNNRSPLKDGLPDLADRALANLSRGVEFDFVPRMRTPERPFEVLSMGELELKSLIEWGDVTKRPIFVLPPIHGSFELLKPICEKLSRPCVGINWTKELFLNANVESTIDSIVKLIRTFVQNHAAAYHQFEIDIVGYSFGATLSFEVMAKIAKLAKTNRSTGEQNGFKLIAGRLVLIDTTPKVHEFTSSLSISAITSGMMGSSGQYAHFLMPYLNAYKSKKVNLAQIYKRIAKIKDRADLIDKSSRMIASQLDKRRRRKQVIAMEMDISMEEIRETIEGYINRCDMCTHYVCSEPVPIVCMLIRAEKFLFTSTLDKNNELMFGEDLGLHKLVSGTKPEVVKYPGDHTTFLQNNSFEIAQNIEEFVNLSL